MNTTMSYYAIINKKTGICDSSLFTHRQDAINAIDNNSKYGIKEFRLVK